MTNNLGKGINPDDSKNSVYDNNDIQRYSTNGFNDMIGVLNFVEFDAYERKYGTEPYKHDMPSPNAIRDAVRYAIPILNFAAKRRLLKFDSPSLNDRSDFLQLKAAELLKRERSVRATEHALGEMVLYADEKSKRATVSGDPVAPSAYSNQVNWYNASGAVRENINSYSNDNLTINQSVMPYQNPNLNKINQNPPEGQAVDISSLEATIREDIFRFDKSLRANLPSQCLERVTVHTKKGIKDMILEQVDTLLSFGIILSAQEPELTFDCDHCHVPKGQLKHLRTIMEHINGRNHQKRLAEHYSRAAIQQSR